jgi:hypothetical protein
MWTTPEGYSLRLPRSALATITSRLQQSGLRPLVRKNYQGNLRQAVARSVVQLVRKAHRTGIRRHVPSGRRFPVFTAQANGRTYQIVTYPLDGRQSAIVSIRSQPGGETAEYMARPPGFILPPRPARWGFERIPLEDAWRRARGPGLYKIFRNGTLVYIGGTTDFRTRLRNHRWCLTHLRLSTTPYSVQVGPMPGASKAEVLLAEAIVREQNRPLIPHQREMEAFALGEYLLPGPMGSTAADE